MALLRCVEVHFNTSFLSVFSSSAYDVVLRQKVAVKKLSRPFQSLIHSRRSYRELRLLKHMKHENVSASYKNTQSQTDAALCMFPLRYWSARLVSVSAGNRAAGRLHTCCSIRGLQRTVNLFSLGVHYELHSYPPFHQKFIIVIRGCGDRYEGDPRGDYRLVGMCDGCHGNMTTF